MKLNGSAGLLLLGVWGVLTALVGIFGLNIPFQEVVLGVIPLIASGLTIFGR
jgi:hypothetical protein